MPADTVKTASENPIILWIVIVILAIIAILSGAKKIGGKVGELVTQWTTSRRRTADNAKAAERKESNARQADMQGQIDYLNTRVLSLLARAEQRDRADEEMYRVLVQHQAWDRKAVSVNIDPSLGPPPPLFPASLPVTQPPVPPGVSSSPEAS